MTVNAAYETQGVTALINALDQLGSSSARFFVLALADSFREVGLRSVGSHMVKNVIKAPRIQGDKLNIRTGRLARSLLAAAEFNQSDNVGVNESIQQMRIGPSGFIGEFGSSVPYARVHERGRFPFLKPALEDSVDEIQSIFRRRFFQWAQTFEHGRI